MTAPILRTCPAAPLPRIIIPKRESSACWGWSCALHSDEETKKRKRRRSSRPECSLWLFFLVPFPSATKSFREVEGGSLKTTAVDKNLQPALAPRIEQHQAGVLLCLDLCCTRKSSGTLTMLLLCSSEAEKLLSACGRGRPADLVCFPLWTIVVPTKCPRFPSPPSLSL